MLFVVRMPHLFTEMDVLKPETTFLETSTVPKACCLPFSSHIVANLPAQPFEFSMMAGLIGSGSCMYSSKKSSNDTCGCLGGGAGILPTTPMMKRGNETMTHRWRLPGDDESRRLTFHTCNGIQLGMLMAHHSSTFWQGEALVFRAAIKPATVSMQHHFKGLSLRSARCLIISSCHMNNRPRSPLKPGLVVSMRLKSWHGAVPMKPSLDFI